MKHLGDIGKIDGSKIEPVDVICGGSPCQDLSIAGKRAGLAGDRSGLFREQMRIIKEMRNAERERTGSAINVRPRFMVWENVRGAFSSNGEKISKRCLKKPAGSQKSRLPICLCLVGGGQKAGASTMQWADGQLLGDYTMRSFGECPREERELHLSQILMDNVPQKYYLSARGCMGILRRAERRGKEIPEELKKALIEQSNYMRTTEQTGG